jgi:hypothetical protein
MFIFGSTKAAVSVDLHAPPAIRCSAPANREMSVHKSVDADRAEHRCCGACIKLFQVNGA